MDIKRACGIGTVPQQLALAPNFPRWRRALKDIEGRRTGPPEVSQGLSSRGQRPERQPSSASLTPHCRSPHVDCRESIRRPQDPRPQRRSPVIEICSSTPLDGTAHPHTRGRAARLRSIAQRRRTRVASRGTRLSSTYTTHDRTVRTLRRPCTHRAWTSTAHQSGGATATSEYEWPRRRWRGAT